MLYCCPCFTDEGHSAVCSSHTLCGRAGLSSLAVAGEHGEIGLRGRGGNAGSVGRTEGRQPSAVLWSSPFVRCRRIKTWSMGTCALRTSCLPGRASAASAAHSSSSVTLASPSLCCPGKVCLLIPALALPLRSLPHPQAEGGWAGALSSFPKCMSANGYLVLLLCPGSWGRWECAQGWSLPPLRS